ncbi:unnamed protein product [Cutaneotrichosporon oleaginosum]
MADDAPAYPVGSKQMRLFLAGTQRHARIEVLAHLRSKHSSDMPEGPASPSRATGGIRRTISAPGPEAALLGCFAPIATESLCAIFARIQGAEHFTVTLGVHAVSGPPGCGTRYPQAGISCRHMHDAGMPRGLRDGREDHETLLQDLVRRFHVGVISVWHRSTMSPSSAHTTACPGVRQSGPAQDTTAEVVAEFPFRKMSMTSWSSGNTATHTGACSGVCLRGV